MTIAEEVIEKIKGACAVTISGGYAMYYDGGRSVFPPAHIISEKHNKEFRCTSLIGEYEDGSRIYFTWSERSGSLYSTGKI